MIATRLTAADSKMGQIRSILDEFAAWAQAQRRGGQIGGSLAMTATWSGRGERLWGRGLEEAQTFVPDANGTGVGSRQIGLAFENTRKLPVRNTWQNGILILAVVAPHNMARIVPVSGLAQRAFPAAFSRTTFDSTAVSTVAGRCEQKPMPT